MKKPILMFYLLALFGLLSATHVRAQESTTDRIVLSDLTWDEDMDAYMFSVSLEGSRIYTAYNMDIFLPDGIDVCYSEEGEDKTYWVFSSEDEDFYPFTKIGSKKTFKHDVGSDMPAEHQLRVSCVAQTLAEFKENSGELFYVYVTLDPTKFTFSPKPIVKVSGIALVVKEDSKKYVPADFCCRPFSTGIPADRTLPFNIKAANKVGTLILPFDAELPDGVKAYSCASVDETENTLNLVAASSFEACTPYLVYAETGFSGSVSGTVDYDATYPEDDVYTEGCLTGVLSATVINTGYVMQNQGAGPQFYSADGKNFSIPAGRCYMALPTSDIKMYSINFDVEEETTEIATLEDGNLESGVWYTLQGVKLDQKPTETGVYFFGQQKIFIK